MRHEPPTIIMLSYRLILWGLISSLTPSTHSHTHTHIHTHTHTPTWTCTYGCRMAVCELVVWCFTFLLLQTPCCFTHTHTHTCAGRWAEDECESMSWHWCRSWPHQRIRLCPLDRDSYSGSHHLILTGLTIILVFSRLALWPQMSSLWKEGGPLTFVLVCCQRLYFLRHLCLFTLERTVNCCQWTHGINILWEYSHWQWEKCLCCSARLSAPRTAPLTLTACQMLQCFKFFMFNTLYFSWFNMQIWQ